jgi:hypothetical protein
MTQFLIIWNVKKNKAKKKPQKYNTVKTTPKSKRNIDAFLFNSIFKVNNLHISVMNKLEAHLNLHRSPGKVRVDFI